MVKVVAFKGQYRVTIPKELAELKGWKAGTRLRFVELPDGSIILRELPEHEEKQDRSRTKKNEEKSKK